MNHYFSEKPGSPERSEKYSIKFYFKKHHFEFVSDNGVFSKSEADIGTVTLLKNLPSMEGSVLDLGCGYGIIGLVIGKSYPKTQVTMVDINERALELSVINRQRNSVVNAEILKSDLYSSLSSKYDYIISNPPIRAGNDCLQEIIKQSINYLNESGEIYLVIQKRQGAERISKLMEDYYSVSIIKEGLFWVICGKKEGE